MSVPTDFHTLPFRRALLTACIAAASHPAHSVAATITVANCNDSGSGSLRKAVVDAGDAGVVNITQACTITLKTGAIAIAQAHLTINGAGADQLKITGFNAGVVESDRIFNQTAPGGYLALNDLTVDNGYLNRTSTPALGGCVYSSGDVTAHRVHFTQCSATSSGVGAAGGAVFAAGNVGLYSSVLSGNAVVGGSYPYSGEGGGVSGAKNITISNSVLDSNTASSAGSASGGAILQRSTGILNIQYSTISNNHAAGGGGIYSSGETHIFSSTISGNQGGGASIYRPPTHSISASVVNTTISGNDFIGMAIYAVDLVIANSTIAFNNHQGVIVNTINHPITVELESSLFSNNATTSTSSDFDAYTLAPTNVVTISGANNLIVQSSYPVPPGTISGTCPMLGPLRSNGGVTQTHALHSHSVAIGQGNNTLANTFDQRGTGHARVIGTIADIGAYELDLAEEIFSAGFDGCL